MINKDQYKMLKRYLKHELPPEGSNPNFHYLTQHNYLKRTNNALQEMYETSFWGKSAIKEYERQRTSRILTLSISLATLFCSVISIIITCCKK